MTKEQFGTTTPIYNKLFYNSLGQLAEIREGLTANDTSWHRGAIINFYSGSCWGMCGGQNSTTQMPNNNGNLKTQAIFVPNDDAAGYEDRASTFVQSFDYDALNRLRSVQEGSWRQWFDYDRYGNRTINQTNTYGTGIPEPWYGVDVTTNRLTPPGGATMQYDNAGNLTYDTSNGSQGYRNYDAESRMTQVWANGSWQNYVYDGSGQRVKRMVGGVGETWQVYGIGGELVAEYTSNGTQLSKEYGYRNGQLLITATVNSGWGTAPTFNDNPLQVGVTAVKAQHITELRSAIDAVRSHYNLSGYAWQYSATTSDYISANPILEMRTALDQALGAGSYAAGLAQGQPVKAIHIQELRDRILAAWQSGAGGLDIRWMVADQLGTPRMIFDQSGSLANTVRHDYLPFGEELFTSSRTSSLGYTNADGARQKYTGYERDAESGLDYAHARYYANGQGRFTSTDPLQSSGATPDPQSWNRYTYALNTPLKFTDPTGMEVPKGPSDSRWMAGFRGGAPGEMEVFEGTQYTHGAVGLNEADLAEMEVAAQFQRERQQLAQQSSPQDSISSDSSTADPSIKPCSISVQFGQVIDSSIINRTGLSFTVDVSVPSGGIAPLRSGEGQGNRHGTWRIQQLAWQSQHFNGDRGSADAIYGTKDDSPLRLNYSIRGNRMHWRDAPGLPKQTLLQGNLINGESFTNITIRGWNNGKVGCEVVFGIHVVYADGKAVATSQKVPF
jgi:RHS repeat-associated protein